MKSFFHQSLSHEAAWELLPWLAQGNLEGPELAGTLDHLKGCGRCREELRFLPELRLLAGGGDRLDPAVPLARLMARVEAYEARCAAAGRRGRRAPTGLFAAMPRLLRLALPAALSLLLGAGLGWVLRPAALDPPHFRTLSETLAGGAPAAGLTVGPRLRAVFSPTTTEQRLREILRSAGAQIDAGPSPTGVYTLSAGAGGQLDEALERLRREPEVRFVTPAAGAGEGRP